jgi:hypothetical protein
MRRRLTLLVQYQSRVYMLHSEYQSDLYGIPTLQSASPFSPYLVELMSFTVVLLISLGNFPSYDPPVARCCTEVLSQMMRSPSCSQGIVTRNLSLYICAVSSLRISSDSSRGISSRWCTYEAWYKLYEGQSRLRAELSTHHSPAGLMDLGDQVFTHRLGFYVHVLEVFWHGRLSRVEK